MRNKKDFGLKTKQIALCGIIGALSVVVMLLGGIVPFATFCCPSLAMLLLIPVDRECGTSTSFIAYAAISVLSVFVVPDREAALLYVFVGYYPLIKKYFDRIKPRFFGYVVKLLYFNAVIAAMYAALIFIFRLDYIIQELISETGVLLALTVVLGNMTFFMLDLFISRFRILYEVRIRKKLF